MPIAASEIPTSVRLQAYDPVTHGTAVAGMNRHILADPDFHAKLGRDPDRLSFLHGHGESSGEHTPISRPRLAILPYRHWNPGPLGESAWSAASVEYS